MFGASQSFQALTGLCIPKLNCGILVPTPYAIKMALLKVLLESQGKYHQDDFDTWIKQEFAWIRDLQIYLLPPEKLVVNRNVLFSISPRCHPTNEPTYHLYTQPQQQFHRPTNE